jgi:hypothetical protein
VDPQQAERGEGEGERERESSGEFKSVFCKFKSSRETENCFFLGCVPAAVFVVAVAVVVVLRRELAVNQSLF